MYSSSIAALRVALVLVLVLVAGASVAAFAQAPRERVDGVTNFGRVTERYFRGGKVTPAGVENLYKLGVRTIIDLRDEPTPDEAEAAARLGITYYNFGMDGHSTPDSKTFDTILAMIKDADTPVYVHCSAGKHRAGTACALYRMKVQGWSAEKAWAEQQAYGFGTREEHPELYAFAYQGGYSPDASITSDVLARASAAAHIDGAAAAAARVSTAPASTASLSVETAYRPLSEIIAGAKTQGATGELLKVDLEYDITRSLPTWDVTFSSGLEYEFHAVSGEFLGSKPKTPAKIATMLPLGTGLAAFVDVMRAAEKAAGQPVQEMELKHIKGTAQSIFEVVTADGTTLFYDAATGKAIAGA